MKWEKLCPNISFTAENKMEKADHISALTWWMRYSISSNFKNLSMNWLKYVFHWEKMKFCTYHQIFNLKKGSANTLIPLSPNGNNANINSNR